MILIHLRLTHYIASFLRNLDEAHPIPLGEPIPIERTDPMYAPIIFLLEPNRRNHVNIDCFSDAQWKRMLQGKYLTEAPDGEMRFDVPRNPAKPLTVHEVYHLAGRDDLSPQGGTPSPNSRPIEEYVTFSIPDAYIIRGGREQRLTPDWYIPRRSRRVSRPIDIDGTSLFTDPCDELRQRFKLALDRYIQRGLQEAFAQGIAITKMALLDRFMTRYDIRPGDREREQLKKVMQRSQNARALSFDADSTTPIVSSSDTRSLAATQVRPLPKRVIDLTTGQLYPSIRAAARAIGCSHNEILSCIARQGSCHHHRLDYADQ